MKSMKKAGRNANHLILLFVSIVQLDYFNLAYAITLSKDPDVRYENCGTSYSSSLEQGYIWQDRDKFKAGLGDKMGRIDIVKNSFTYHPEAVIYRFRKLNTNASYEVTVGYMQQKGEGLLQSLEADGIELHGPKQLPEDKIREYTYKLPGEVTKDGEIALAFKRVEGGYVRVHEILLYEVGYTPSKKEGEEKNLFWNSDFEINEDSLTKYADGWWNNGWYGYGGVLVKDGYRGEYGISNKEKLKCYLSLSGVAMKKYTLSFYAKGEPGSQIDLKIYAHMVNELGINKEVNYAWLNHPPLSDEYQRYACVIAVPSDVTMVREMEISSKGKAIFDSFQLEGGYKLTEYIERKTRVRRNRLGAIQTDGWIPKVLVVIGGIYDGDDYNSFIRMFNELGWVYDFVMNTDVEEWIDYINDYDVILPVMRCNYYNKVDFSPYGKKIQDYVKGGGELIDAVGPDPNIISNLGSDFKLSCILKGQPLVEWINPSHVLANLPYRMNKNPYHSEAKAAEPWSISGMSSGWEPLVKCKGGMVPVAAREYGKGVVVAFAIAPRADEVLFQNLAYRARAKDYPYQVKSISPGKLIGGENTLSVELEKGEDIQINVHSMLPGGKVKMNTVKANALRSASVNYDINFMEGTNRCSVIVDVGKDFRFVYWAEQIPLVAEFPFLMPYLNEVPVPFTVNLSESEIEGARLKLEIQKDGEVLEMKEFSPIPNKEERIEKLNISNLKLGRYDVVFTLLNGNGDKILSDRKHFTKVKKPRVWIDKDLTLMIEDKPFFPLGISDVPQDDIKKLAEVGFNVVIGGTTKAYFDECSRYGVHAIIGDSVPGEVTGHPAIIAMNFADEPELWGEINQGEFIKGYERLKEIMDIPLLINGVPKVLITTTDIDMEDNYPFYWIALENLITEANTIKKVARGMKPLWLYPQSGCADGTPAPKPREIRAQAYLAITQGIRGLIWFAYKQYQPSRSYDITKQYPESWEYFGKLIPEMASLAPVFLSPELDIPAKLTPGNDSGIYWTFREYEGYGYLIVVNSRTSSKSVGFSLPVKNLDADVLFENRRVKIENGLFNDLFGGYDVRIYKIGLTRGVDIVK